MRVELTLMMHGGKRLRKEAAAGEGVIAKAPLEEFILFGLAPDLLGPVFGL